MLTKYAEAENWWRSTGDASFRCGSLRISGGRYIKRMHFFREGTEINRLDYPLFSNPARDRSPSSLGALARQSNCHFHHHDLAGLESTRLASALIDFSRLTQCPPPDEIAQAMPLKSGESLNTYWQTTASNGNTYIFDSISLSEAFLGPNEACFTLLLHPARSLWGRAVIDSKNCLYVHYEAPRNPFDLAADQDRVYRLGHLKDILTIGYWLTSPNRLDFLSQFSALISASMPLIPPLIDRKLRIAARGFRRRKWFLVTGFWPAAHGTYWHTSWRSVYVKSPGAPVAWHAKRPPMHVQQSGHRALSLDYTPVVIDDSIEQSFFNTLKGTWRLSDGPG